MKVVIDTRMSKHGGIGTYITNILKHVDTAQWHLLNNMNSGIYTLREQLELPQKIPKCDVFWSPHFNVPLLPIQAQRRVVTIHDVFHLDNPQPLAKKLYAKTVIAQAVHRADYVITISEFSKKRLLHYFPNAAEKIRVIYCGCDHLIKEKRVQHLPDSYFLFVGNQKPHKNFKLVLEALKQLPDMHLVVTGEKGQHVHDRVHYLGQVAEEELTWLYTHAQALIFPSFYEGWGLPPLEAMRLGCPVLASFSASIPEACGEGAVYFSPTEVDKLIERIKQLPQRRKQWILAGKQHAEKFTWKKCADAHLQILEEVFSMRP